MNFLRVHKTVTYLIAAMGMYALTLGGGLSQPSIVLLFIGFVASAFAERPMIEKEGYSRAWTAAVVAMLVLQGVRALGGESILEMALEYVGFLQISRLFNRRTGKDYHQITVLAFLHLIAATVLTTSVVYGLIFIGFLIVTPWMLTVSHLRVEIEENQTESDTEAQEILQRDDVVGSRFLVSTALLTLPIFVVTIVLFLLFPRVGLGFARFGAGTGQPTTGFGKNVQLGGFGTIREDPTVVLRVTVPPDSGFSPAIEPLRMRGTAFDRYDGKTWLRSDSVAQPLPQSDGIYPIRRRPSPRDHEYKVVLEQLDEPVMFLPEGAIALKVAPRVAGGRNHPRTLLMSAGFDFRYDDKDDLGLVYSAFVSEIPQDWRKDDVLDPYERKTLLQIPEGTRRVAEKAKEVTKDAESTKSEADRILYHLRESGEYSYSLEQPDTTGRDPLDVFVFEAKSGHCEYFSTAMAIMLRGVGIPARNVTGFVGGTFNQYGGYYALRRADAHSWVEAYIDGRWVTYDPTPPARNAIGPDETGFFATVRAMMDAARTRWAKQVVGFNLRMQTGALREAFQWLRKMRSKARGSGSDKSPSARDDKGGGPKGSQRLAWLFGLLPFVVLAGLVWAIRRNRKQQEAFAHIPPKARPAARIFLALEDALERRGVPRPSGATPSEHSEHLRRTGFEHAEEVQVIAERSLSGPFGDSYMDDAEVARYMEKVRNVASGNPVPAPRSSN